MACSDRKRSEIVGYFGKPDLSPTAIYGENSPLPDIEQPLTGRNLIKPTDLFPKQTQDFDLHLIQPFNQVVPLALDGHTDTMNPFEVSDHGVNSLKINGLIF